MHTTSPLELAPGEGEGSQPPLPYMEEEKEKEEGFSLHYLKIARKGGGGGLYNWLPLGTPSPS